MALHFLLCWSKIGDLKNEEAVLEWLSHQVESDEIEDVTDEMLDMLISKSQSLAALFCKDILFSRIVTDLIQNCISRP